MQKQKKVLVFRLPGLSQMAFHQRKIMRFIYLLGIGVAQSCLLLVLEIFSLLPEVLFFFILDPFEAFLVSILEVFCCVVFSYFVNYIG